MVAKCASLPASLHLEKPRQTCGLLRCNASRERTRADVAPALDLEHGLTEALRRVCWKLGDHVGVSVRVDGHDHAARPGGASLLLTHHRSGAATKVNLLDRARRPQNWAARGGLPCVHAGRHVCRRGGRADRTRLLRRFRTAHPARLRRLISRRRCRRLARLVTLCPLITQPL